MTAQARATRRRAGDAGQSLIEFALVLPFLVILAFGVIELSYALLDQHVVTSFSREGSNLISRNTSLKDAVTALRQMTSRPLNLEDGSSTIILSVVRRVGTPSAANYDRVILYQRTQYGTLAASSQMTGGGGAFGPAPDYQALDPDNDTALRLGNVPVTLPRGGTLYITEVFATHMTLTPIHGFGVRVPDRLYSIAYF
jgi:Flp pilus assembly protein TadG